MVHEFFNQQITQSTSCPTFAASHQGPSGSAIPAFQEGSSSQLPRDEPRRIAPRLRTPTVSFVQSTGHGPDMRIFEPGFASGRPQRGQGDAGISGTNSDPSVVGAPGQVTERRASNDKGKGRLVLRKDESRPSQSRRGTPSSCPGRGKSISLLDLGYHNRRFYRLASRSGRRSTYCKDDWEEDSSRKA